MIRIRNFTRWLSVIAVGALVVRVGAVLTDWRKNQRVGITDEFFYHAGANLLAEGRGLINPFLWAFGQHWEFGAISEPTALHPPLFTLVLSGASLLGIDTTLGHRLVNVLLGVALVAAIGLLARELASPRVGLGAAAVAAVYPHLWINDTAIMPESLYSLLVVLALLVGYRLWREPSLRLAVCLGVLVALAALTRSEGILLFPFVALPFVLLAQGADRRAKLRLGGAIAIVGAVLLAPWLVRNLTTFDEPTFMATGSGHVLAIANCDRTYGGELVGYWDQRCSIAASPLSEESVVDAAARRQGLEYIRSHKADAVLVAAVRVGRVWDVFRPLQNVELNATFERRGLWPSRLALSAYFLLLIPASYGLWALRRRRIPISPIVGLFVALTVTSAVSIGITRYRAPADAVLPVLAAIGVDAWLGRRRSAAPTEVEPRYPAPR